MAFFLAIDAGGTKTDYLLANESRTLARVRTGTIKRLRTDNETAALNLEEGLLKLTAASGVSMSAVNRTCIGTAGETVPLVADWLRSALARRVAGSLLLLGDVEIVLDAVSSCEMLRVAPARWAECITFVADSGAGNRASILRTSPVIVFSTRCSMDQPWTEDSVLRIEANARLVQKMAR
jgi:hypothetical protein